MSLCRVNAIDGLVYGYQAAVEFIRGKVSPYTLSVVRAEAEDMIQKCEELLLRYSIRYVVDFPMLDCLAWLLFRERSSVNRLVSILVWVISGVLSDEGSHNARMQSVHRTRAHAPLETAAAAADARVYIWACNITRYPEAFRQARSAGAAQHLLAYQIE
jgi:hypothetical protein